jgi:hypothetical protein
MGVDAENRVFVNGRERPVIMENMRARMERGDLEAERREAIQVCFSFIYMKGIWAWADLDG